MTEAETDAAVARLVPEFEANKLEALDARSRYYTLLARTPFDRDAAMGEYFRWQKLEACCSAILDRIEQMAALNAQPA